jgi:hypothetical protein
MGLGTMKATRSAIQTFTSVSGGQRAVRRPAKENAATGITGRSVSATTASSRRTRAGRLIPTARQSRSSGSIAVKSPRKIA